MVTICTPSGAHLDPAVAAAKVDLGGKVTGTTLYTSVGIFYRKYTGGRDNDPIAGGDAKAGKHVIVEKPLEVRLVTVYPRVRLVLYPRGDSLSSR